MLQRKQLENILKIKAKNNNYEFAYIRYPKGIAVLRSVDKIVLPIGYKSHLFIDELKCVSENKIINIYFKFKKKQND
jgi:hypothetical protein